jgi:hypothetical protein
MIDDEEMSDEEHLAMSKEFLEAVTPMLVHIVNGLCSFEELRDDLREMGLDLRRLPFPNGARFVIPIRKTGRVIFTIDLQGPSSNESSESSPQTARV